MMVKVDLHKAYDTVDWNFLKSTLTQLNFPKKLVELIMFSLKESCISVIWNGEKLDPFQAGRGLRQGDPLAPYLFILVMEVLSWAIQDEVRRLARKSFRVARRGVDISHLFFADDLLLFAEASENQISIIMGCISKFSKQLGLSINLAKSTIFCSPNTCDMLKRRIGDLAKIPVTHNMGKYLGIPILQKRVSKNTFAYILENMTRKLASWKTETLSLAGRRVLTQSALASIPVYTMQAMVLPKGTCEDIDRICRNFL